MKKKILVLAGIYNSANGICVQKISKELSDLGYIVHCIYYGELNGEVKNYEEKNISIYNVKMTLRHKIIDKYKKSGNVLLHYLARLITFINYINYPFLNLVLLRRYYKKVIELNNKELFDQVISVYNPIESLYAANALKKENPNIKWILYCLDPLTNVGGKNIFRKYFYLKNLFVEKKYFSKCDKIINMISHFNYYSGDRYKKYSKKMVFSDIPMLDLSYSINRNSTNNNKIVITYGGSLNYQMRNPTFVCDFFSKVLLSQIDLNVSFYSVGNCTDIIKKYEKITKDKIRLMSYVSHEKMLNIISNSDMVLSLENENSDMVPSKIFEYFSLNKKIVHFYKSQNDILLNYFKNYPNVLLINKNDNFDVNFKKFKKFIETPAKDVNNLEEIFKMNTVKYTIDLIIK